MCERIISDAVWWYLHDLSSVVVAESGIATDRYHIGKIILRSLKDAPGCILQIDGATDEKETFKSVLNRSTRCASAFRNIGLKYQDVIFIMAPNHLDLTIPMYAALYLGVIFAGIDMYIGISELQDLLRSTEPKLIFCENSNVQIIKEALNKLNMSTKVVTFGEKKNNMSFNEFLDTYASDMTVDKFKTADFNPKTTKCMLITTSGSTGLPKPAALTHENVFLGFPNIMLCLTKFPSPIDLAITLSPVQWISSLLHIILSPILKYTRLQSSLPLTVDHFFELIKKYNPQFAIVSATLMTTLLKSCERYKCNFSSFKQLIVGGSAVSKELLDKIEEVAPNIHTLNGYGMTESSGVLANSTYAPRGSIGMPVHNVQFKLVDTITNKYINEPNVPGELRIKGPIVMKEYYNNPEMTAAAFDEGGWLKTGDLFYRDENCNYYFVDRLKLLLKYKSHQISPAEIENIIIKHPSVQDVAVTGIPDEECGDLPVAFVVPLDGCNVSVQEIKDLVKTSLSDVKQLRGGVIFLKEMPKTSTLKINRLKLKEIAKSKMGV